MTPEQLKASILQYAIQGKLVEQRPEEGTAEELYQQIQKEKQKLIKEGKIKKEKPLAEITDEEVPFDIPESWKWVRLGNIIHIESGKGLTTNQMKKGNIPVYGGNGVTGYHNEALVHKKTIVIGRVGFYCGSIHITPDEAWVTDNAFITTYPEKHIDREFMVYMLRYLKLGGNSNATAQPVVSGKKIYPLLIPLPPLKEQHRIVAKIEELLPCVDRYAEAYEKLEQFNAKFPEDMKKSILQYAIQGKLVEQRPEEGTAEELYQQIQKEKQKLIKEGKIKKEKPLPEITEDEIPFEIPESWKWVRLGECGCFERGSGIKKDEVRSEGKPCIRYGQLYTTYKTRFSIAISYISDDLFEKCHKAYKNDILMALTGENEYDIALAVTYEGDEEIAMGGDMTRFFNHHMDPIYLTYVINSRYGILCKSKLASGNIIVHISNDKLASIPIPVPPLEEQHRIVSQIHNLLPYCDQLKHML